MPDSSQPKIVEQIHASGRQLVMAITGGGSRAIADLLTVPGASATVLEAVVPYSLPALEDWLGGKVNRACSEQTARAMAMAAFERARQLSPADRRTLIGIGATASLVSTRPKRGPHRIHVAWQTATATVAYSVELVKDERSRADEEAVASQVVLTAVAEACGVANDLPSKLTASEQVVRGEKIAPAAWTELLLGERRTVDALVAEATRPNHTGGTEAHGVRRAIFSGAFNPLHTGHRRMAELAAERLGVPITLELSTTNVDKPPLDFLEIDNRLRQLADFTVLLTRAPTFVEKAAIFPGSTFVVGADTIARIADPAYYGGSAERRDAAIAAVASSGCRFLVFGRDVGGRFVTLTSLDLPSALRMLCEEVPESEFRDDSASTRLRVLDQA
jgi:nicotinamide mononucleotide (NMN) deamidase PncC